jgi:hypothetical protein
MGNASSLIIKTDLPGDAMAEVEATYNLNSSEK